MMLFIRQKSEPFAQKLFAFLEIVHILNTVPYIEQNMSSVKNTIYPLKTSKNVDFMRTVKYMKNFRANRQISDQDW